MPCWPVHKLGIDYQVQNTKNKKSSQFFVDGLTNTAEGVLIDAVTGPECDGLSRRARPTVAIRLPTVFFVLKRTALASFEPPYL